MEYTGLNLQEVLDLPCDLYYCILRRIIIAKMMSTEQGRADLEEFERSITTEVDVDELADFRKLLGV